jgi:hypothetical protein
LANIGGGSDPLDCGLWQGLLELQAEPDLTARVANHNLTGDTPVTRLAGLITGPAAAERWIPGHPCDERLTSFGAGSALERAADQLRGGAARTHRHVRPGHAQRRPETRAGRSRAGPTRVTTTVEQLDPEILFVEVTDGEDHDPRCEATCDNTTHGHDPWRCTEPATERVTVICTDEDCDAAACVALLCEIHADDLESQTDVVRRPL